ncbi:MAG: DUF4173 domain-containing protein [Betaproteobacteria bacterium]|nr:DUF4173 domain-containing protein [Betaproteobacteria bacterium]
MDPALSTRVESMFSRDRAMALAFVVVLWLTILFVYFAIAPLIASPGMRVVLIIGAALLLLFNTASMIAMIRHYRKDKEHIYGLDIRHMDEEA